jgi:hypothetical protein
MAFVQGDLVAAEQFARAAADRMHNAGLRTRFRAEMLIAAVSLRAGRPAEARAILERIRRLTGSEADPDLVQFVDLLDVALADDAETWSACLARSRGHRPRDDSRIYRTLAELGAAVGRSRGWS